MAAPFQSSLANDPSSSNMVPPMAFRFMYGVTDYPPAGNGKLLKSLQDSNINYIGTAAEGGLSNKMLVAGHMLDGMPFNYWYAVAWCAINLEMDLANEVINGSNTTVNPLYYEQNGIDRLQRRGLKTLRSGISYGLILGQVIDTKLSRTSSTKSTRRHLRRQRGDQRRAVRQLHQPESVRLRRWEIQRPECGCHTEAWFRVHHLQPQRNQFCGGVINAKSISSAGIPQPRPGRSEHYRQAGVKRHGVIPGQRGYQYAAGYRRH